MSVSDPQRDGGDGAAQADPARRLSLYVALGDSFSAGAPGVTAAEWPGLLAAALRSVNPGLEHRNLAVAGSTSARVLTGQLPRAIQLEPDLVTVVCGGNDVLGTTRPSVSAHARSLTAILRRLAEAVPGVRIATATMPERWEFLGLGPRTCSRIGAGARRLNAATIGIAEAFGVACLDVTRHPGLADRENFSADGLHPSAVGHRRAAAGFAALLQERYGVRVSSLTGQ